MLLFCDFFYDFLPKINDVNVLSKSNKRKKCLIGVLKVKDENSRMPDPDPAALVRGEDPDPYQNVTDPQSLLKSWALIGSRKI